MNPFPLFLVACATILPFVHAHSTMSEPQSMAPMTCRMGGEPRFGVEKCPGPCDLRAVHGHYANFYYPDRPAAVYKRGDIITIKYQRNNHGPGGFIRVTFVEPKDMMNKAAHSRNAFHYSCWGANPRAATAAEKHQDMYGFSVSGNDGDNHHYPVGVYEVKVKIPTVLPDKRYILGFLWYGGVGGDVKGNSPQEPTVYGYFGDYWSCSFVEIRGGPLENEYTPVFVNDMPQYSSEGCMAANDAPGTCTFEPCTVRATYQKPKSFKNGPPKPLTLAQFGGTPISAPAPPPAPQPQPAPAPPQQPAPAPQQQQQTEPQPVQVEPVGNASGPSQQRVQRRACRCIALGSQCYKRLANLTDGCSAGVNSWAQSGQCRSSCCQLCSKRSKWKACQPEVVKNMCAL